MRIRITHLAGVGEWPCGAEVDLPDRRAQGLVSDGYAVPAEPPVLVKKKKEAA